MTREQQRIVDSWTALILRAIRDWQEPDTAYRVTRACVGRFVEIGVWPIVDGDGREWLVRQGMTAAVKVP
jgi:hypothetical protein